MIQPATTRIRGKFPRRTALLISHSQLLIVGLDKFAEVDSKIHLQVSQQETVPLTVAISPSPSSWWRVCVFSDYLTRVDLSVKKSRMANQATQHLLCCPDQH